jgi:hypothetical protein
MNARERDWIMVRVRREVHAQLVQVAERLWRQYVKGYRTHYSSEADKLPLSSVIAELLRRDQEHQERGRKASTRKKARRAKSDQAEQSLTRES